MIDHAIKKLIDILGPTEKEIGLHEPHFAGNEWKYVKDCLDSGWVSSVGQYVTLFEEKLSEITQIPYAIAVTNGTAALHIALLLAEVKPNDEVLVPSLTFIATANAVTYCQAIPHFIDSSFVNLGIDLDKLAIYLEENCYIKENQCYNKKTSRRIKAIIPVHIFGHAVDMLALQAICLQYHIEIIEDAAESLGSYCNEKHTGNFGKIASLSFNGNKITTCGGGGAILTHDPMLAKRAKHLTTTAKRGHRWDFYHDEIGYNYRLPNINAALGCAQLEKLQFFVEKKRALAKRYIEAFCDFSEGYILEETSYCKSNYWLNALILNQPDRNFVENFIEKAHAYKYGLRGLWTPMHQLPMYARCPKMNLSNSDRLYSSVIALPSSVCLETIYA